ncbi:MAG: MipA/OmpV family protein [Burkholderiaceae bacterium]
MRWPAPRFLLLVFPGVFATVGTASSQTLPEGDASREYLIGASLESSAGHIGDGKRSLSLRPVWYFQLGPVRVSRSRASTLLGTGRKSGETGLSADLLSRNDWRIGASLRWDNGRTFENDPVWRGLPDIRTTVRGRVSVRRPLGERWGWGASLDQDLLGRDGGMRLNTGLNYTLPVSDRTRWDIGASMGWGNARYMDTHFGISPTGAAAVNAAPYQPGGGMEGLQLSWNASTALGEHWVMFGGIGVSRLLGDAARSPLVSRRFTTGVTFGLAYRDRR